MSTDMGHHSDIMQEFADSEAELMSASHKVRTAPRWPGSWANFASFVSCFPQECMGRLASPGPVDDALEEVVGSARI
jgi:hypothetical protein